MNPPTPPAGALGASPGVGVYAATAPASLFAAAFARNQTPINSDANRTGATLVTYDNPTGERHSSPHVWKRYAATNQNGLTSTPLSALPPPMTMNKKPIASSTRPSTILSAVEGSRPADPRPVHSMANSGAKMRIASGFTDWNQLEGTLNPPTSRLVFLSANSTCGRGTPLPT